MFQLLSPFLSNLLMQFVSGVDPYMYIYIFQQLSFLLSIHETRHFVEWFQPLLGPKALAWRGATRVATEICNRRITLDRPPCTEDIACLVSSGKLLLLLLLPYRPALSFFYFDARVPLDRYNGISWLHWDVQIVVFVCWKSRLFLYTLYAELLLLLPLPLAPIINVESYFHNISDAGVRKRNWS